MSSRPSWPKPLNRWLDRACALLLACAPAAFRARRGAEIVATIRESCVTARQHRGRISAAHTACAELLDLAWSIVRLRLNLTPPITAGTSRQRSPSKGSTSMSWLAQDLRLAIRGLAAGRMTTAIVVLTLALGIGINAAVFSVLDSILWRPVPFAEASRLVTLWSYNEQGKFSFRGRLTSRTVMGWREQADLFDRVEAYEQRTYVYEDEHGSDLLSGTIVSPGLLSMLGVRPAMGRIFTDADGKPGTDHQAIVSDRFWRERLQRDRGAVGRQVVLNGTRYDVVGVMPAAFRFPDDEQDLWLPYDVAQPPPGPSESLVPLARMHRGLTRAELNPLVIARGRRVSDAAGDRTNASARAMVLGQTFDDKTERSLLVLGGAVGFLLLIVCANVTNLVLSRALPRMRDAAIRLALGASRRDVIRETLVEHLLLGVIGAVAGVFVAQMAIAATLSVLPEQMTYATLNPIDLDGRALTFLALAALVCVAACGLPAAIAAARSPLARTLSHDSRASTGSAASRRIRAGLVVAEVSLSIVLLVGAALMTRSLMRLQAIDIGLDPSHLVTLQMGLPSPAYSDVGARDAFTKDLLTRLHQQPGIQDVSAGDLPPRGSMVLFGQLEFSDRPEPTKIDSVLAVFGVWPDYFRTSGIRLLQGRDFSAGDPENPAIVSAGFANKYFGARSPIGLRFRLAGATWRTIVGVTSEVHNRSDSGFADEPQVYYPYDRVTDVARVTRLTSTIAEYRTVVVRADSVTAAMTLLPAAVHAADPRVVVSKITPVARMFADGVARPRIVFLMMTVFAVFGLVLAGAGLYGVLSCLVAQRMRELGIRVALGARPRDLRQMILGSGLRLTLVGVIGGLALSLALVRLMRSLLYEVDPSDPTSMVLVAALLLIVAVLASWFPARRAMRVDPVTLLRE